MTDMTDYDSYLFKILPEVDGCPPIVAEDKVRDTIIDICQQTSCWRDEAPTFYLTANVPTYEMLFDDFQQLAQIDWGYLVDDDGERTELNALSEDEIDASSSKGWRALDGTPKAVFMLTPSTIRFAAIPNKRFACTLGVTLKPSQDSFEAPSFIFNHYLEIVAAGAKMRLLNMKGRTWYDPAGAMDEEEKYNNGIRDIRINATRSHTRGPKIAKMRPMA